MCFRADEEVTVNVIAKAAAKVPHEVIAAHEIGTGDGAATGELVEAKALPSDSGHEFGRCVLAQFGCVDPIKIIEEGTIGLEAAVKIRLASPREFAADPVTVLQKKVGAENRVGPTGQDTGLWSPEALDAEGAVSVPTPKAASNCCA